jgi:cell division septal protein FtsQ
LRYFLLSLLLAVAASGFYYVPWSLGNIQSQVIVKGNKVATCDQVRNTLKSTLSVPLYQLSPRQLEEAVSQLPMVKHAFVRRYCLPTPRIIVEVLEEFPWASYTSDPETKPTAVIAESGRMIPIAKFPSITQPALKIYGPASLTMTSREVAQWATWIAYIQKQTQETVEFVDLREAQDVRLKAGSLYLKVGSADASLSKRLARLASLKGPIESLKDRLEYVDLGLDSNVPLKLARKEDGHLTEKSSRQRLQL